MKEIQPSAELTKVAERESSSGLRRFLWENSLTLTLLALFLLTLIGQILTGLRDYNADEKRHSQPTVSLARYLTTGHFWEVTAENWESEFLQMAMFVLLTVWLRQKGSPESKQLEGEEPVDQDPREKRDDPNAPWPVRRGGAVLWLYSHSLSITFVLLFLFSFFLHAAGGSREFSAEREAHGEQGMGMLSYVFTSRFWFESFQNWQSEFLSLAAMVWLAVYLRERGSAESKPVAARHDENE